jgi:hypothetical protein
MRQIPLISPPYGTTYSLWAATAGLRSGSVSTPRTSTVLLLAYACQVTRGETIVACERYAAFHTRQVFDDGITCWEKA